MAKDASVKVIWQKNKDNPWTKTFRLQATKKSNATEKRQQQEEPPNLQVTNNNDFETKIHAGEQHRDEENIVTTPRNNINTKEETSNEQEREDVNFDSHQQNKDGSVRSLSNKMKKKTKNKSLDFASTNSILTSFSSSFTEIMKAKFYKELVDDMDENEKEKEAAAQLHEFDLMIANRKSREFYEDGTMEEGTMDEGGCGEKSHEKNHPSAADNKGSTTTTAAGATAHQTLDSFLATETAAHDLENKKQQQQQQRNHRKLPLKSIHSENSETLYDLGKIRSVEDKKTERTKEKTVYFYDDDCVFSDEDDTYNNNIQTSQSQTVGTESFVDDPTTMRRRRKADKKTTVVGAVLRGTGCCVTPGSSASIRASSKAVVTGKKIVKPKVKKEMEDEDAVLPVELAMRGENTLIHVDGEQVSDVMFLRGRRVYRLNRNKLKGKRFFSSTRVYESVEGKSEALIFPKERELEVEDEQGRLPENAQVTRLTKSSTKKSLSISSSTTTGQNSTNKSVVGISNKSTIISKGQVKSRKSKQDKKKKMMKKKKKKDITATHEAGYSADEDEELRGPKVNRGPSYRHLNPGKSIYWLKVGEDVDKKMMKNYNVDPVKSIQWLNLE